MPVNELQFLKSPTDSQIIEFFFFGNGVEFVSGECLKYCKGRKTGENIHGFFILF